MKASDTRSIKGYDLLEQLGEGAYGAVFRARQQAVDREVALKVILPQYANQPDFIRRFEAEAQLIAHLEHLHIVPLYDYWRNPDGAFLVMRLMKGGSLEDSLAERGPWHPKDASRLVDQIASALEVAHQQGVVHRDLKPANILLDEDGNAYLSDFGIAKAIGVNGGMTATGAILGTPAYISPEQVQSLPISPQTDIYSLGVVLYELLTGEHPFPDTSAGTLIIKHAHETLPLAHEKRPDLPREVDEVIQKATFKDPTERYPDPLTLTKELRRALQLEGLTIEVGEGMLVNPYKGLRAFQETDADDFFGRQALTEELVSRLKLDGEYSRFLAIVGPSGSGKSSVVKAGLIPALRNGALPGSEQWFIIDMIPKSHPIEELDINLSRISANPNVNVGQQLASGERGLLRCARMILPKEDGEFLLVVDQFEEIFTLAEDKTEARHFMDLIYAAVSDAHSQVRVIITLRADFYDRPLMYPDFSKLVKERTSLVIPLTTEELEEAIRAPAERAGTMFDKGLVSAIITDVIDQPGALPMLQYALTELFERRKGRMLTSAAYQSIGGVFGALGKRAEDVYNQLNKAGQEATRQLFLRLVSLGEGVEDTRRRLLRSEIDSLQIDGVQEVDTVIETFGNGRLLTFDRDLLTRDSTVEVAHEALLREWQRLRTWLDESRADIRTQRSLARAATEWLAANKEASFLLRGYRLAQFEGWVKFSAIALTQVERSYLEASLEARQAREAMEKERQLRELKQISIGLAGQAFNEMNGTFPERAVLLAIEALENYPYTWQAHRALGEAVLNHRLDMVFSHNGGVNSIALSQDGKQLLTGSNDGTVRIWDPSNGEVNLLLTEGDPMTAKWSPDENVILTIGGHGSTIQLWDSETGSLLYYQEVDAAINYRQFNWFPWSAQGDRFVTAQDNKAIIWEAATCTILAILAGHEGIIHDASWSPSSDFIVTASEDNTAILWDAKTFEALDTFPGTDWGIRFGSWTQDGERFALRGLDRVSIYDTTSAEEVLHISLPGLWTNFTRFSLDGTKIIATIYQDGTARLFDAETGQLSSMLSGLTQGTGISWSPNGDLACVVGGNGSIRVWDISTGLEVQNLPFFGANQCKWSPSGERIYAVGLESTDIKVFKLSTAILATPGMPGIVGFGDWSPDSQQFGRGFIDGTAKVWSKATGQEVFNFDIGAGGGSLAGGLRWSPSSDRILTWNADGTLRVWDASSGELLHDITGHEGGIFYGDWSSDGTKIVTSGTKAGEVTVWDSTTGEQVWQVAPQGGGYGFAKWSADGKRIISTGSHRQGTIRDAATGEALLQLFPDDHPDWVEGAAWSRDGRKIVIFSSGAGQIFDATTGEVVLNLSSGHTSSAWVVYWSPTDELIYTLAGDGTYRIFDALTGRELLVYETGGWPAGALSPDGTQMLIGTNDGATSIFPTWETPEELIAYAKECCVLRELTPDEREVFGLPER